MGLFSIESDPIGFRSYVSIESDPIGFDPIGFVTPLVFTIGFCLLNESGLILVPTVSVGTHTGMLLRPVARHKLQARDESNK